ncbi:hypothetical protein KCP73_17855 [Salmonella enterica subsp. enterica]|nr:hypothetical protein KCP73_17855 [Salmonella enterica subsp. enterica]
MRTSSLPDRFVFAATRNQRAGEMPLPRRSRRGCHQPDATFHSRRWFCGAESDEFLWLANWLALNYDGWRHPLTPYRACKSNRSSAVLSGDAGD